MRFATFKAFSKNLVTTNLYCIVCRFPLSLIRKLAPRVENVWHFFQTILETVVQHLLWAPLNMFTAWIQACISDPYCIVNNRSQIPAKSDLLSILNSSSLFLYTPAHSLGGNVACEDLSSLRALNWFSYRLVFCSQLQASPSAVLWMKNNSCSWVPLALRETELLVMPC